MSPAELSRRSGLTSQHISQLLNDDREKLVRLPDPKTIAGLSKAFGISEDIILIEAARAYGVKVDEPSQVVTAAGVSDEALLAELGARLAAKDEQRSTGTPVQLDIDAMEHRAVTDIIDLMQSLLDDAETDSAEGRPGVATARRFLAGQLEAALASTVATEDRERQANPA